MSVTPSLRRAFQFFLEHAGYIVGERAKCALHLTRAEAEREIRDWGVEWAPDDYAELGDHAYWCDAERRRVAAVKGQPVERQDGDRGNPRFDGWCEHYAEWCRVYRTDEATGKRVTLASLGGNIDMTDADRRVVEAELALEALAEERRKG